LIDKEIQEKTNYNHLLDDVLKYAWERWEKRK
jgi:predicted metalloprotease with PDZ domain